MTGIAELLKGNGLKVTPQRIAIYNYLINTKSHPSADIIYKALEEDYPALSLATVYKTLDTFRIKGLIQELNIGEDSFRYDADNSPHPHFLCRKCGKVYDLPMLEGFSKFKEALAKETGHIIDSEQLYLYGSCKTCS